MKKKILISIGIILTILPVLFFGFVISIKKTPTTVEQYVKVMNKYGVKAVDLSNQIPESLKQFIYEYGECADNRIGTYFYVYDSGVRAAAEMEAKYKKLIAENSTISEKKLKGGLVLKSSHSKITKDISVSNKQHYKYKTFHCEGDYAVFIRVENTLLMIAGNELNKDIIDLITKELGYHIGNTYPVLFGLYIIGSIFTTILVCFYLANVFKAHNVRPWLAFIPIVNAYYLCKITVKNGWKMLFFIIPYFCYIYYFIVAYKLAKIYTDKKLICFGIGFLPLVLLPVIAFDKPKIEEKPKNVYEEILKEEGIQ